MKTTNALLLSALAAATISVCCAADESANRGFDVWVRAAFLGEPIAKAPVALGLEVRRQDHGEFHKNQSVMKTPLRLGGKSYKHGLGTHSVSEIVVRLEKPAKLFEAEAGIDNNYDTDGKRGSAVFAVEVGGWNIETSYRCIGLKPSRTSVKAGEPFTVTAVITDTFLDGSRVALLVDGQPADAQWSWARGSKRAELAFKLTLCEPGTHRLTVADRTVEVKVE